MSTSVVKAKVTQFDAVHAEAVAVVPGREKPVKFSLEFLDHYSGEPPERLTRYSPKGFTTGIEVRFLEDEHDRLIRVMPAANDH